MSSSMPNPISTISGQSGAGQYGFVDPYGVTGQLQNSLYGAGGTISGGPMGTFNANVGNVTGMTGPLQQSLTGIANYQAQNALNTTASNFANQGALGSGAGAQAFGQAIASPFANAQAQLQSSQLGLAQGLMGASSNAYGQALGAGSNLMEHASGLVAPTYMTNPAYTAAQQGKQGATGAGTGLASSGLSSLLGPTLSGAGTALANAAGKGAAVAL